MRTRRVWPMLVILLAAGCSTHPIADTLDTLRPGRLYPDTRAPYGGVCVPQGPGVTGTSPASPVIPPPPVVPPPAPLPPGGVAVPNIPPPGGLPVPPLGQPGVPPPPSFPG
jgi:hypothetical protein